MGLIRPAFRDPKQERAAMPIMESKFRSFKVLCFGVGIHITCMLLKADHSYSASRTVD